MAMTIVELLSNPPGAVPAPTFLTTPIGFTSKMFEMNTKILQDVHDDKLEAVKDDVKNGANVFAQTYGKDTLLHYAVKNHSVEMVRFLVEHGANPLAENENGITPLSLAKSFVGAKILSHKKTLSTLCCSCFYSKDEEAEGSNSFVIESEASPAPEPTVVEVEQVHF